jgi:hypothetical protein
LRVRRGGRADADRHRDGQRRNSSDQHSAGRAAHQQGPAGWHCGSVKFLVIIAAVFHREQFGVVVLQRVGQLRFRSRDPRRDLVARDRFGHRRCS